MATSSIFRTPQFETEESVRSLVEAMEATMSAPVPTHAERVKQVRHVKDPQEVLRILESAK